MQMHLIDLAQLRLVTSQLILLHKRCLVVRILLH